MKKVISSILSLSLILGSVNTSFAAETPQMETNFTIKTNFPTQPTTKTPELTEKEKQELKAEKEEQKKEKILEEKLKNAYSGIMEANPCMKVAFEEIQALLSLPNRTNVAKEKLEVIKAEEKALLAHKKTLSKDFYNLDESTEKQLKNIDNRLKAIEYMKNFLTDYLHSTDLRFWKVFGKATFRIMTIYFGINGFAYLMVKYFQ